VAKKPRPSQRGRSVRDYRRVEGTRQPRPAILIVCEGAATEPQYFKGLIEEWKLKTSVDIEVVGAGKQHITLVRRAIQLRDEREQADRKAKRAGQLAKPAYDEVWCVFDAEGDEAREAIARAVAMANDEGFKLAISNPAFEYWLLLHFEPTTRPFHTPRELQTP
jgi:aminoglycoside phosphotransferase